MTVDTICIPQNPQGSGGLGGGQGYNGQTSQIGQGFAARSYGIPVIKTTTGINASFKVRLTKDLLGTVPANLSNIHKVKLICKTSTGTLFQKECGSDSNQLTFTLTTDDVNGHPGLHYAGFLCYDSDSQPVKEFKCCVQIMRGLTGCSNGNTPLTIQEVRMQAYDMSAERNQLLNDTQFSDLQIVYAIQKAIDDWNQMPPALANTLTVQTFPYRSNLCTGAIGHLYKMAAYRYARNQMRHSNAGLTLDDNDKTQVYTAMSQAALAQWKAWVQTKKTQLNQMQCMGTISDGFFENYTGWLW